MKLNVKELEVFARSQGYENGIELFESIGYTAEDYNEYANGKNITRSMLLKLYREIGATDVVGFVEFGAYEWEKNIDLFDRL